MLYLHVFVIQGVIGEKNDINNDFRIYGIHLKNHDLLNSMGIEFKVEVF